MSQLNDSKKCIAIHLPVDLLEKINDQKAKTAQSQSGVLIDLIEKGLGIAQSSSSENNSLFYVKVRIDPDKMTEFGQKLQSGEIDTSQILLTYCLANDPAVGISFWKARSKNDFEEVFAQHSPFYKEIIEIKPVISPMESMKLILEQMNVKTN
jgi:hypothetical protein